MSFIRQHATAACLMPFIHFHVSIDGKVRPCCISRHTLGDINSDSIADIWQGENMREFRRIMMRGELPESCSGCYKAEQRESESLRMEVNRRFAPHEHYVAKTAADGRIRGEPAYWDIRFSNVCNFRCRTCWHGNSSAWFPEAQKLNRHLADSPGIYALKDRESFFADFCNHLDDTEEIFLAGGEPLLMPEHLHLLKLLNARKRTDITLRYHTNVSALWYKNTYIPEMWKAFDTVKVGVSLDAAGKKAEYLRKGTRWDELETNIRGLALDYPGVQMFWVPTVSVFNALDLPSIHRYFINSGLFGMSAIKPNMCRKPAFYNIKILPKDQKISLKNYYQEHQKWLTDYYQRYGISESAMQFTRWYFQSIVDYAFSESWSAKIPQFTKETWRLDALRNEDFFEVFPRHPLNA